MSMTSAQAVAVAPSSTFRERGGQGITTPAPLGYPSLVHATRPLRSSPLAGPAFSSNLSVTSSESRQSHTLDIRPYSRSIPSSIASHNSSPSASTSSFSSYAHRAPGPVAGPSKSTTSVSTLNLDTRPQSSVTSHTGSFSTGPSFHAHNAPRVAQVKSTSAIPTLSVFRPQAKEDPSLPPSTQPPFVHNRSISFAPKTISPPAHIPKTYNPRAPRPSTSPAPSVSRNPDDNWISSSPFGPAATPRFSRQSMSYKPIVMPLSAHEYRRQKCASMNVASSVTSDSPAGEVGKERRVNDTDLPHIIISDSESSHAAQSRNRPSRRASSPSPMCPADSQPALRSNSPEPQLSSKSSSNTFFSVTSENEGESSVIRVIDPGVTPRRRLSTSNVTQRHSRLSLVDAVNRLSVASGDTEFYDTEENFSARRISVTEDDGVFRRASSRRRTTDGTPFREMALGNTMAKESTSTAPLEYPRMVRIAETCEASSDKSPSPVLGSRFSDSSHDCQRKDAPAYPALGEVFPDRAISQPTYLKPPGVPPLELQARPRKKLTKCRTQPVEAPPTRLGSPSPWVPVTSPLKARAKQDTPTNSTPDVTQPENVTESPEPRSSGKGNKRWTSRLTFQFIPSRLKSTPSVSPSLDQKPSMRNEIPRRPSTAESGFGMGSIINSHVVTRGSATTITLVPPPPIMSSSSASSSAANSTSSLTGSSATMISQDTSATSIGPPSFAAVSRLEYPYLMVPSNLKESIVIRSGGDAYSDQSEVQQENSRDEATTPPPVIASHDHELQEKASSLSSVSSYVSFPSISTAAGSIPNSLDAKVSGYHHPMWTVPMVTTTAASQTPLPRMNDYPTVHEPPVRPNFIPTPPPAPTSKIPSTRPPTARLRRPRPQTAPGSPSSSRSAVFPTSSKSAHPQKAGMSSSGFKSIFRNLVGRTG